jgi:hypothetical protein
MARWTRSDMRILGRGARLALVCGIWMLTSGCLINALFSSVAVTSLGAGLAEGLGDGVRTTVSLQASASVRRCADLPGMLQTFPVHCTYVIDDETIDSDANLVAVLGILGFIIDPLILQVPAAAGNFSGTFSGGSMGNLSITEVPGTLPADISSAIAPEPGTRLVIVDFPNPPPLLDNQSFGFSLNFQLPGDATPVRLKALFAGRVESNGQTFFVPLLPCETNFANIPTITLPEGSTFQNVNLPLTGVHGCAGTVFNLSAAAQAVPTMSTWGLLLLGAATAGYGVYRLRPRYREAGLR